MCLLQAKQLIALIGKKTMGPNIGQWVKQMFVALRLEQITYLFRGKKDLFENIWRPFIIYVEGIDLSEDEDDV